VILVAIRCLVLEIFSFCGIFFRAPRMHQFECFFVQNIALSEDSKSVVLMPIESAVLEICAILQISILYLYDNTSFNKTKY
jgi:hypothetical protein